MNYKPAPLPPDTINSPAQHSWKEWRTLVLILFCIFFGVVFFLKFFPPILTALTPRSLEEKIGEVVGHKFKAQASALEPTDQALVERIKKVLGPEFKEVQVFKWESPEENAYSLPGKRIYLSTGFLSHAESDNEKIFVISHEFGHQSKRHALKMVYASLTSYLIRLILGYDEGLSKFIFETSSTSFSRGQEKEADMFALEVLSKTSKTAQGAFDFFKRESSNQSLLDRLEGDVFSTHPLSQKRIEYLLQECRQRFRKSFCQD